MFVRLVAMNKTGRKRLVTLTDRKRIVSLWLRGGTARSIALTTGTSLSTVYRWVRWWEKCFTVAKKVNRAWPHCRQRDGEGSLVVMLHRHDTDGLLPRKAVLTGLYLTNAILNYWIPLYKESHLSINL